MKKILLGLMVVVSLVGCGKVKEEEKELQPNQVGYSITVSDNGGRYYSYLLNTPRGYERCEGDRNLMNSLNVYIDNGTYGTVNYTEEEAEKILNEYGF